MTLSSEDGSFILDVSPTQERVTVPDFIFCPEDECGHEICQMRNLTAGHSEKLMELNVDYNYWEIVSYLSIEHEFDEDGDHKMHWNINHDEITEGLAIPVKYVFTNGFKADDSFEFLFSLRMCSSVSCTWETDGTYVAQVIVKQDGNGQVDLAEYDPEISEGSCPISYKFATQPFGIDLSITDSIVSIYMNIAWMRAYDGYSGLI